MARMLRSKKAKETTLYYKHEFYVDRVSHGKASVVHKGTRIRVYKSWEEVSEGEFLG